MASELNPQEIKKLLKVKALLEEMNLSPEEVQKAFEAIRPEGFDIEGVHFPEETAFLSWHKGNVYVARVKNGLIVNDRDPKTPFTSLSTAAAKITGFIHTNGRDWWTHVIYPNRREFVLLRSLLPKESK